MFYKTDFYHFSSCFIGDTDTDEGKNTSMDSKGISRGEKSHLVVWQVQLPMKKGDSIFLPEDMVRWTKLNEHRPTQKLSSNEFEKSWPQEFPSMFIGPQNHRLNLNIWRLFVILNWFTQLAYTIYWLILFIKWHH